jgi:hypothetical protein
MENNAMQEGYIPQLDDRFQDVNVTMSSGILGDRIEQIKIRRDSDRSSTQIERHFRKHLEIPTFPDVLILWIVLMAFATFITSILLGAIRGGLDEKVICVVGIFSIGILIVSCIFCARAISAQPHLKWGALYRWIAVLFGAILGAIYD